MTVLTRPQDVVAPTPTRSSWRADALRLALIVVACMAIFALFIPRIVRALSPLTGDEPFYVMTALSLAHDHDLDETNNYAQKDYLSFYPPDPLPGDWAGWPAFPRELPPHAAHSVRPGLFSKHGLGVAVLIMIPYLIHGRVAVILFLNFIAALTAANMVLLARRYGHGWLAAGALVVPLVFVNPLMSYAYLIFPETFAALALIYAYRRSREPTSNAWQWLGVGLAIATLPWLHARFIPAVIGLVVILRTNWLRELSWRRRLAGLLPPAISALALLTYWLAIYGKPFPSAEDHAGFNYPLDIVNAAFGLLLDEQWGLLIHAPIYLLTAAGLGTLWRLHRADARAWLAVVVPYYALVAFYLVWWGEWGPAARYLAPLAPLAIAPLACWAATVRRPLAIAATALLALPGFVIMGGFLAALQLMYNQPDGHNALFTAWANHYNHVWPKLIPSFQFYALSPTEIRVSWSLMLILVAALLIMANLLPSRRAGNEDRPGA
jgi:hypothetical protein